MHRETPFRFVALHVFGLWAIAVAHPLLDVLGRSAEFFVAHRAQAPEIFLLLAALLLPGPLLLAGLVALAAPFGSRARSAATVLVVALLCAVAVVPLLKHAGVETWPLLLASASLAGLLAGAAYLRLPAIRTFFTIVGAAVVVVPAVFLLRPSIGRVVLPRPGASGVADARSAAFRPAPIVLIVFDELPLVSLLDRNHDIDPVFYPNLSALARDGVWFRNATTVNDYTRWALPAILTGRRPEAADVPTPGDHPDTLFTFFGSTHRLEVFEAVTDLCPRRLCGGRDESIRTRFPRIGRDVAILAAYVFLTPDLHQAMQLPELTGNWAGLGASDDEGSDVDASPGAWMRRWHQARQQNKRDVTLELIDGIDRDDPQPTFYFLHTLLSHHPWTLLPGGQRNSPLGPLPSAMRATVGDDEWVIVQQQRRHLLQMGYIDRVVGRLTDRLRAAGLYDRALIVVTADHGAAFTPGRHMRSFAPETAGEIMRVPLVMKFPSGVDVAGLFPRVNEAGQRVTDRNVETIDIAPTIADALGSPLPWPTDGSSLLDASAAERPAKLISYSAGRKTHRYGREGPSLDAALKRRLDWFNGSSNAYRIPRPPRFANLLDRKVSDLPIVESRDAVNVRHAWRYASVEPGSDELPYEVSGELDRRGGPAQVTYLAIAVNGVIRAVTRTWGAEATNWLATPPLDAWREGENVLEIFAIEESTPLRLRRVWRTTSRPADLNLISGAAEHYWNVRQRGFFPHEGKGDRVFRWTRGHGVVALDLGAAPPSALHLHILRSGRGTTTLRVTANGCPLYDGPAPRREWRRTFSLEPCAVTGGELEIVLASDAKRASGDARRLGVAVRSLTVQ